MNAEQDPLVTNGDRTAPAGQPLPPTPIIESASGFGFGADAEATPVGPPPSLAPATESMPAAPSHSSGRAAAITVVGAPVVVVLIGACVWFVARRNTEHIVSGSMTILDSDFSASSIGSSCSGKGGYSDIGSGGQVTVKDGTGKTIAVGSLGSGHYVDALAAAGLTSTSGRSSSSFTVVGCRFTLTVADVPDADFYRIEIGHRRPVEHSRNELESMSWNLDLSLGP